MADERISTLPTAAPVTGAEQVPMAQSGVTVKLSLADFPVSLNQQAALDEKANAVHVHAISEVTGLQSELNGKEPSFTKKTAFNKDFGNTAGTVAEGDHEHGIDDITGLQTALDAKASTDIATQLVDGLMSSNDKIALDEINFPPVTNDPSTIGELALELTSDTTLTIKVRGSDNIVRSVALTLS